jgi:hypothetical protein
MLGRFISISLSSSGFFRQQTQQKQKIRVHVPGDELSLSFIAADCISSSFLRQQLEQQHVSRNFEQHGLQHLKQFIRLQQLGFFSPGMVSCMVIF